MTTNNLQKADKRKHFVKNIAMCAIFAALVFLPTAFLHIPVGVGQIVHFGDAMIYIAACVLPFPFGPIAGSIGGALADVASGYMYWAPFTAVIKFLIALPYTSKCDKILTKRNSLVTLASMAISMLGYYIATVIIMYVGMGAYGAFEGSFKALLLAAFADSFGFVQDVGSIIFFFLIGFALDKAGFKKFIKKTI